MSQNKLVLVFLDALQGVNFHRLQTPFLRLISQGMDVHFFKDFDELKTFNTDFISHIVVYRRCTVNNYQAFKAWLVQNAIKLVLDLDDYWELPKHNEAYKFYKNIKSTQILETIKMCDIIWTPSRYLGNRMSMVNRKAEVYIIPNTLDLNHKQWKQRKKPSKEVRFGYVGAKNHGRDINEISYTFEGKQMYCVGLEDYPKRFKASHILNTTTIGDYGKLYENFDVSLAPLQGGTFNKCKSDLKVVEAGYTRSSIIASNTTPYKESIKNNVTGLLCSSSRDWKNAIESMTKEKHRELSGNLNKHIKKNYDLDKLNKIRTDSLGL